MTMQRGRWVLLVAVLLTACAPTSTATPPAASEPPPVAEPVLREAHAVDPAASDSTTHQPSPEPQAREHLERCEAGEPVACHAAALDAYYVAPRDPGSDRLAYERFTAACDGGYAPSCSGLGVMIMQGRAGPVDTRRALQLFASACEAGASAGCRQLAEAARTGQGLPPDPALVERAQARERCASEASLGKAELASCPALGPVPVP